MHDTTGNQHIGNDDLSRVDEHASVGDGNSNVGAVDSLEGRVGQNVAVANGSLHDVVGQDRAEVGSAEVWQSRANGLESSVGRREDGDILETVDGADEVCGSQSAGEGGEVQGSRGHRGGLRDSEDFLDDVDDTASEVDILVALDGSKL